MKRTLHRVETNFFKGPPWDDVYNQPTADAVAIFQRLNDIQATGHFGQATLDALWPYADAYSRWVYRVWTAPKPKPMPPELIEPNQGFHSLHSSLREDFSLGRHMGLSDLGTHNPSSKLPSGAPSDHAVWPAMAFDLGVEPDTGYANPVGRSYFTAMIGRPEVEYVILGDKIWSRAQGLHSYGGGGHANHVHVSGNR